MRAYLGHTSVTMLALGEEHYNTNVLWDLDKKKNSIATHTSVPLLRDTSCVQWRRRQR